MAASTATEEVPVRLPWNASGVTTQGHRNPLSINNVLSVRGGHLPPHPHPLPPRRAPHHHRPQAKINMPPLSRAKKKTKTAYVPPATANRRLLDIYIYMVPNELPGRLSVEIIFLPSSCPVHPPPTVYPPLDPRKAAKAATQQYNNRRQAQPEKAARRDYSTIDQHEWRGSNNR